MITGVGHIGILVHDVEEVLSKFCKRLGLATPPIKDVQDRQMKVAVLNMGNTDLEFIEDYSDSGTFARIVKERGETIHHLALLTGDIDADFAAVEGKEGETAAKKPSVGLRGKRIVFIEPELSGGITIELTEP